MFEIELGKSSFVVMIWGLYRSLERRSLYESSLEEDRRQLMRPLDKK